MWRPLHFSDGDNRGSGEEAGDRKTKAKEGKFTTSMKLVGEFVGQCRSPFIDPVCALYSYPTQ